MKNTALNERNRRVENGMRLARPDTLIAIILAVNLSRDLAVKYLASCVAKGAVDKAQIDSWITVFTNLGITKDRNIELLWQALKDAKYALTPDQLLKFYRAMCNGGWSNLSESIKDAFYGHPETNERHIISAIKETTKNRKELFAQLAWKKPSLEALCECLSFEKTDIMAIEQIKALDEPEDTSKRILVKQNLLASLERKNIRNEAFALLCRWKLLDRNELWKLSKQDGVKHLAKRELKNKGA